MCLCGSSSPPLLYGEGYVHGDQVFDGQSSGVTARFVVGAGPQPGDESLTHLVEAVKP